MEDIWGYRLAKHTKPVIGYATNGKGIPTVTPSSTARHPPLFSRQYPLGLACPITIIWKPLALPNQTVTPEDNAQDKSAENIEETRRANHPSPEPDSKRTVWLMVHPCVFDTAFGIIQLCASLTLARLKETGNTSTEIEIADLRTQLNIFEIMGPKSNQVIKGALSPAAAGQKDDFTSVYKFSPASLESIDLSLTTVLVLAGGYSIHWIPRSRYDYRIQSARPSTEVRSYNYFADMSSSSSQIPAQKC
ncbi:Ribonucleases P/MRP protein [Salix suchowensis]|nr:Ribonucleases P/MRP protein [Salix suchowensis]